MNRSVFTAIGVAAGIAVAIAWWVAGNPGKDSQPPATETLAVIPAPSNSASLPNGPHGNSEVTAQPASPLQDQSEYSPEDEELIAGIAARQLAYDRLLKQPPMQVWQFWETLFEQNKVMELTPVTYALAQRLQQGGDEKVYQEINTRLQQADLPADRKVWLVGLLTEAATPEALDILLKAALGEANTEFRGAVLDGIRQMGDKRWGGGFHPELSSALEDAWSQADDANLDLLNALAMTTAKVGAPSGVEHLVLAMVNSGKTVQEIKQGQDARALAAFSALEEIRNPEAIPILVKWFHSASPTDTAFIASGEALAAMGLPDATKYLLEWAKQAPDEAAPLAGKWLGEVRDTESVQLLRNALLHQEEFRSGQIKERLVDSLNRLGSAAE